MKITKTYLRSIIKEELQKEISLKDMGNKIRGFFGGKKKPTPKPQAAPKPEQDSSEDERTEFILKFQKVLEAARDAYINDENCRGNARIAAAKGIADTGFDISDQLYKYPQEARETLAGRSEFKHKFEINDFNINLQNARSAVRNYAAEKQRAYLNRKGIRI